MYPFKEELIHKMENMQQKLDEEKLRQRKARQQETTKRRSLESVAADARLRDTEFDIKNADKEEMEADEKKANVWHLKGTKILLLKYARWIKESLLQRIQKNC